MATAPTTMADKPLRADAQRNRERLIAAGREVFAERGFDASLDDVAERAGVGVGTAYRRFPNKEALIDEIFEQRIREIVAVLEQALEREDAWEGLKSFIADLLRFQAEDRGLKQAYQERQEARGGVTESKARLQPMIMELIERSQASGSLRADVSPTDVMVGVMMLGNVIDATRDVSPDAWERYLVLILDGLAAQGSGCSELPGVPLTPEQFDEALHCSQQR